MKTCLREKSLVPDYKTPVLTPIEEKSLSYSFIYDVYV